MSQLKPRNCFYCLKYNESLPNYPINQATICLDSITPRCLFHGQYLCDLCKVGRHFNGIAWCHNCKKFTCVRCSDQRIRTTRFFTYAYHYEIKCAYCQDFLPTLEYAEYIGQHPFQNGDIHPPFSINVWLPIKTPWEKSASLFLPSQEQVEKYETVSGKKRLWEQVHKWSEKDVALSSTGKLVPAETRLVEIKKRRDLTSVEKWSRIAPIWNKKYPDFHHKELIIPYVVKLLNPEKNDKILDIGCGEGNLTRIFAKKGATVTGVDPSDMINFAIAKKGNTEIKYIKGECLDILEDEEEAFDKILANMMLMDVDDKTLENIFSCIRKLLKTNGTFVFSILHPCFGLIPVRRSLKIPFDSEKNTDRIIIVDNYFDEGKSSIELAKGHPTDQFHRTISTYVNHLASNGLMIEAMIEPKPTLEQQQKYPREAWQDYDRIPVFLIVKARKVLQETLQKATRNTRALSK